MPGYGYVSIHAQVTCPKKQLLAKPPAVCIFLLICIKPPSSQPCLKNRCYVCPTTLISHPVSSLLGALLGLLTSQITMVTGQTGLVPHQVLSRSEKRGGGKREKEGKKRREDMNYQCAVEQMENDYFMVIVWCLILDCNGKILILSMGWIFDEWKRNSGSGDLRESVWGKVIGHPPPETRPISEHPIKK